MADFELNEPGTTSNPWTPAGVVIAKTLPIDSVTGFKQVTLPPPIKGGEYPDCPGATAYGFIGDHYETPIFHGAHDPSVSCAWSVMPAEDVRSIRTGDVISITAATGQSPTFTLTRNGIEVPRSWRGYPRWWMRRLYGWWLTRTASGEENV